MIRCRNSKRTFIISVLAILLCLVSLVGATLALFTSNTNDGTIGIVTTSGEVDVDMIEVHNDKSRI